MRTWEDAGFRAWCVKNRTTSDFIRIGWFVAIVGITTLWRFRMSQNQKSSPNLPPLNSGENLDSH